MSRMRLIGKDNDNVTLSTLERIDVSIYAPIGVGSGTTLFYGELGSYQGYTWTIETSEPDKPLEAW